MNAKIPEGYILKARVFQRKKMAHCSPTVREIWDWLLMHAQWHDIEYNGYKLLRGQLFTTYEDIRESLHWHVGYRKHRYSEDATKAAMKTLRTLCAITSTKTPRGIIVTIVNYNTYQNPKNYEDPSEDPSEDPNETPMRPQHFPSIIKEGKEGRRKKYMGKHPPKNASVGGNLFPDVTFARGNHPGSLEEMIEYAKKYLKWDLSLDEARKIWDYYTPPGRDGIWRKSNGKVVTDWTRCMVTWKRNDDEKKPKKLTWEEEHADQLLTFEQMQKIDEEYNNDNRPLL